MLLTCLDDLMRRTKQGSGPGDTLVEERRPTLRVKGQRMRQELRTSGRFSDLRRCGTIA